MACNHCDIKWAALSKAVEAQKAARAAELAKQKAEAEQPIEEPKAEEPKAPETKKKSKKPEAEEAEAETKAE